MISRRVKYAPFDSDYILHATGYQNYAASCWWNASLQFMQSLTCINRIVQNMPSKNPFAAAYASIVSKSMQGTARNIDMQNAAIDLYMMFRRRMMALNSYIDLVSGGQNCALQGITAIIDALGSQSVNEQLLLSHLHEGGVCQRCGKRQKFPRDDSVYLGIIPARTFDTRHEFEMWLRRRSAPISDFKCDCGAIGDIEETHTLCAARSVIILHYDKYFRERDNTPMTLPQVFSLPKSPGKYDTLDATDVGNTNISEFLNYRLIACVRHVGNPDSGHYYVDTLRREGIVRIDDASVTSGTLEIDPSTFIVGYQLMSITPAPAK